MRLNITKSKNAQSLYVIRSTYVNGKHSSEIVEKLGTYDELKKLYPDPIAWAKDYIKELNEKDKQNKREVILKLSQSKLISKDTTRSLNGGYLFLQSIFYALGLNSICNTIKNNYKFTFDLTSVLSRLIYARILYPSSKLTTFEESRRFIEQPDFELQHVYRTLDVITKEDAFIQAELYKNSLKICKRNDKVLYYDCTNYFFESEEEAGLRQYGHSKEHRPNPIVQMGLFIDGDGIPLAFSIFPGNQNEQQSLLPLEKRIIEDFHNSKFIVCTDSGLASNVNRKFNNIASRAFITTQSLKKLKKHLRDWTLSPEGWHLEGSKEIFDINNLENSEENIARYKDSIFFKERWINENGLEQKLIVTFSLKYKYYMQKIRNNQLTRAKKIIEQSPSSAERRNPNDCRRFIKKLTVTSEGEIAKKRILMLNEDTAAEEARYDGFYAVCSNLDEQAATIAKINRQRWEIEECFRIMKTNFKARPVYLHKDERIKAHFMTCFLALIIFRFLEKKIKYQYTSNKIIETLREMNFLVLNKEDLIPTYTRTDLTDTLHEAFKFRTDYQILSKKTLRNIFSKTKEI